MILTNKAQISLMVALSKSWISSISNGCLAGSCDALSMMPSKLLLKRWSMYTKREPLRYWVV